MSATKWKVQLLPTAQKELDQIPLSSRKRIIAAIALLAFTPHNKNTKKLKGVVGLYRLKIGSYRAIYRIFVKEHLVIINRILPRQTAYRNLN